MATTALQGETKPPISRHPAFPAIVALWFAALLGCGTLVMPTALLERAVEASRLASFVPAASPPLGTTAHALVALLASVVGALIGLVVARRVAVSHATARLETPRPLNPREELDDEDDFDLARFDMRPAEPLAHVQPRPPAPEPVMELQLAGPEPECLDLADTALAGADDADFGEPIEQFPTIEELERRRAQRRSDEPPAAPGNLERRLFLRRSEDETLPFAAPPLARPDNENAAPDSLGPQPTWQSEPLEDLGLLQLVERLGASLARHREISAAVPAAPAPLPFEAAPADEAAEAMAAYFKRADAPVVEAVFEEVDDEPVAEEAFGSLLTLRQPTPPAPQPDEALRRALATLQRMSGTA